VVIIDTRILGIVESYRRLEDTIDDIEVVSGYPCDAYHRVDDNITPSCFSVDFGLSPCRGYQARLMCVICCRMDNHEPDVFATPTPTVPAAVVLCDGIPRAKWNTNASLLGMMLW